MANKRIKKYDFDVTVTPATTYAGSQALPYVTAAVKSNDTIAKGYVRQMDGLAGSKAVISSLVTTDPIVAATGACNFADAGTTTLGERVLTLEDLKVNREVCRATVWPTWVGENMKRESSADLPTSFSDFLLEVVANQASAQIENGIWVADAGGIFGAGFLSNDGAFDQAGLNASACADFTQVTMNSGAATSATNIDTALSAVYDSVVANHPGLEFKQGFGFYMNNKTFSFYQQYLAGVGAGQGVNLASLTLDSQTRYFGHPIYRCPGMPDDAIVATYTDNLVVGSSLGTELVEAKIIPTYQYDGSDNVRVVMNFGLGVQSGIGTDGVVGCIF